MKSNAAFPYPNLDSPPVFQVWRHQRRLPRTPPLLTRLARADEGLTAIRTKGRDCGRNQRSLQGTHADYRKTVRRRRNKYAITKLAAQVNFLDELTKLVKCDAESYYGI